MSRLYVQSEATAIRRDFPIFLVALDGVTAATSAGSATPQLWVCGSLAWTNCATSAIEVGNGFYSVRLTAGELGTLGPFAIRYKTNSVLEFNMDGQIIAQNLFAATVAVGSMGAATISQSAFASNAFGASLVDSSFANKIADHALRRTYANARQSADGDAVNFRSMLGAVGKLVNRWNISGSTLTLYQEDDATSTAPGGTQTLTSSANATALTSLDTD